MKRVAVFVLNYNGKPYIQKCLASLEEQTYKDFDTFLIDNDSTDGSLNLIKIKESSLILHKKNYGYAKGNNIGVREALRADYKYIVLVNVDTMADKDWLKELVKAAENPEVGAVQPKILIANSKSINTTGNVLHFLGFGYCANYGYDDTFNERSDIAAASGASVLYKSAVLKKVGLLDETFFMYLEDTDLSWRIREVGYRIIFEPKSIIYHHYAFSRNKTKFYHAEKNRIIFILKNYELKTILLLLPAFIITELLMLLYSAFGGWLGQKIKGYGFIIKHRKEILASRRKIQKTRKVKDKELKKYFSYKLAFNEVKNPLFAPLNLFFGLYWFLVRSFI